MNRPSSRNTHLILRLYTFSILYLPTPHVAHNLYGVGVLRNVSKLLVVHKVLKTEIDVISQEDKDRDQHPAKRSNRAEPFSCPCILRTLPLISYQEIGCYHRKDYT